MSKSQISSIPKGEIIPSKDDIKNVEGWLQYNLKLATKSYHTDHKWNSFGDRLSSVSNIVDFYRSKYFNYYLTREVDGTQKTSTANVRVFNSRKDCSDFINSSGKLIYRCSICTSVSSIDNLYMVYYHNSKIGWLKSKLQFLINYHDISKEFIYWFYNLKKVKMPKIKISLVPKD